VYASSPQKALLGTFQVADVISGAPAALWDKVGALAAVTRDAFDTYYQGAARAYAIVIGRVMPLGKAIPLARLRDRSPGFHPPQSYRYLDDIEAWMVGESSEKWGPG
jgi:predicted transcriptional regulator